MKKFALIKSTMSDTRIWRQIIRPEDVIDTLDNNIEATEQIAALIQADRTQDEDSQLFQHIDPVKLMGHRLATLVSQLVAGETLLLNECGGWMTLSSEHRILKEIESESWPHDVS